MRLVGGQFFRRGGRAALVLLIGAGMMNKLATLSAVLLVVGAVACFTVADLCAASIMTAIIRPPQFPYPLPQPWPDELHELRERHAQRPGFKWVLDIYARHRGTSAEVVEKSR